MIGHRSLFDESAVAPQEAPAARRGIRVGTPEYDAFWSAFQRGAEGAPGPVVAGDRDRAAATASGYKIGRLFRPLQGVTRK